MGTYGWIDGWMINLNALTLGHCSGPLFYIKNLISMWGEKWQICLGTSSQQDSFMCHKSTTAQVFKLCFPSEESHANEFYRSRQGMNSSNLDSVERMVTTRPPMPTYCRKEIYFTKSMFLFIVLQSNDLHINKVTFISASHVNTEK